MAAGLLNNSYNVPSNAVFISAGTNIQSVVNQHGAGTTYVLGAGTHYGQTFSVRSGDTFIGQEGAVLDGNGADHAINGWNNQNVTIANIRFTDYAPSPNGSGILGNDSSTTGWKVLGNEFDHISNGAALRLGNGMLVQDNTFHDNLSNGISSWSTANSTIQNNEFWNNNASGNSPFSNTGDAAAIKITQTTGTQILDNYVHDTANGIGIWTDINCDNTLIQGNLVQHNGAMGIAVELDYGSVLRGNTVVDNNTSNFSGWGGAGIYIFNAQDAEVTGNTVAGNGGGVFVYEEGRGSGTQGTWVTRNVNVHDNTIIADEGPTGIGGGATNDGSIQFQGNDYNLSGSASFYYGGSISASQWQALGYDTSGSSYNASAGTPVAPASPPTGSSTPPAPAGDGSANTLVLEISQDAWRGDAQYTVSVDGVQQGGVRTASALHGSGDVDVVEISGDWSNGEHSVSVAFVNDLWGNTLSEDRNLWVEAISYDGTRIGGDAVLYTQSAQSFGFTDVL
ncbi:right-handed parallel beta-helix repeat-containing protein [Falsiroseomonas sp. HW251]|uniref:right-handed parallel beta-helix repeat-containing protein n=1 Tax=Falsiroseomonas sp. HW251 TaxID=3390998 RepID=UPI003D315CC8